MTKQEKDDGGPAFPRAPFDWCDEATGLDWAAKEQRGMSLRAWFAGMAMQGLASQVGYCSLANIAYDAVVLADALIAELKK